MKIIYLSSSDYPFAAVAGAVHCGLLPQNPVVNEDDLKKIKLVQNFYAGIGFILFGRDKNGSEVYALQYSCKKPNLIKRMVVDFLAINNIPHNEYRLVDMWFWNKYLFGLCSILAKLGLNSIKDWLIKNRVAKQYPVIVKTVKSCQKCGMLD